jgi:hypothetical protein
MGVVGTCGPLVHFHDIIRLVPLYQVGEAPRRYTTGNILYVLKGRQSFKGAKLICDLAPALSSIKYEIQHFDLPPVPEGPFVGKGDEVDEMWNYITDGGKSEDVRRIMLPQHPNT